MSTFYVSSRSIDLPAIRIIPNAPTCDLAAWMHGEYITVKLMSLIQGIRVHTNDKSFPGRPSSKPVGRWIALDDIIQTSGEFVASRSLPGAFTHVGEALLPVYCVINVGICSAKFGGTGGEFQAEYVSGPQIQFRQLRDKYWHGKSGTA